MASAGPFAFSRAPPAALCSLSVAPLPFELALELRLVRAAAFPLERDPVVCRRERDDALGLVRVAAFARGRDVPVFDALLALFVLAPLVVRFVPALLVRFVPALLALLPELLVLAALLALLPELLVLAGLRALLPELARAFALVLRVPPDDFVVAIDLTSLPYIRPCPTSATQTIGAVIARKPRPTGQR